MTVTFDVNCELEQLLLRLAAERGIEAGELLQQILRDAVDKLLPAESVDSPRIAGLNAGQGWISADFDAPLPDSFWTGEMSDETAA